MYIVAEFWELGVNYSVILELKFELGTLDLNDAKVRSRIGTSWAES